MRKWMQIVQLHFIRLKDLIQRLGKAFFSEFPKCDILLNNNSEVFNSYILEGREMAVLSMLEYIFYKIMQRLVSKQREAIEKWAGQRI